MPSSDIASGQEPAPSRCQAPSPASCLRRTLSTQERKIRQRLQMGLVRRGQGRRRKTMLCHLRRRPTQRSSATPICPAGGDGTGRWLYRSSWQYARVWLRRRFAPSTTVALATNVAVFTFQCTKGPDTCWWRKSWSVSSSAGSPPIILQLSPASRQPGDPDPHSPESGIHRTPRKDREICDFNPLLFDFVLKRTIRHPTLGNRFPA